MNNKRKMKEKKLTKNTQKKNPLHNYYILIKNLKKRNQLVQSHSNDNSTVTVQKQT
jgi:hypothetical protein